MSTAQESETTRNGENGSGDRTYETRFGWVLHSVAPRWDWVQRHQSGLLRNSYASQTGCEHRYPESRFLTVQPWEQI